MMLAYSIQVHKTSLYHILIISTIKDPRKFRGRRYQPHVELGKVTVKHKPKKLLLRFSFSLSEAFAIAFEKGSQGIVKDW